MHPFYPTSQYVVFLVVVVVLVVVHTSTQLTHS